MSNRSTLSRVPVAAVPVVPSIDSTPIVERDEQDELPPVYQFPIVRTVPTKFFDAGRHQPLRFPDSDD